MKIWFRDFSAPSAQLSLFAFAPHEEKKKTKVISALDRIREKHGDAFIQYGKTIDLTISNDKIQMTNQTQSPNVKETTKPCSL